MDIGGVRVDMARSKAGEWVGNIPGLGDIELKVRGSNTPQFRLAQAKAQRAIPREARREGGLIDPEAADIAAGKALADGVLIGWRNVSMNGAELPYSPEAAERLLTDPEMGLFRECVMWAAEQVAAMRKGDEDDSLGK
jgi:hypothetical protein